MSVVANGAVRQPGFRTTVVLSLALGISANTAIFSILHALVLGSLLPVSNPDGLVVGDRGPGRRARSSCSSL